MGGTTMVMAMVLPEQHCSLVDAYENCRALADAKVCCDYALHVGVTWWGAKVRNEGVRLRGGGGWWGGSNLKKISTPTVSLLFPLALPDGATTEPKAV